MDPLRWVVPVKAEEYQNAMALRSQDLFKYGHVSGLISSLWLCCIFLYLRSCFNRTFEKLYARSPFLQHINRAKLEEEYWVILGGVVLVIWSWFCLSTRLGSCGLRTTYDCVAAWPAIKVDPAVQIYYNIEMGWYLHLLLKHSVGLGLEDRSNMVVHHWMSISLILFSYYLALHKLGIIMLALFSLSNPLLHMSKLANLQDLRPHRTILFAIFALAFLISRIVLLPVTVLKCSFLDVPKAIPGLWRYYTAPYLVCNALLVGLYIMQLVWGAAIVRMLRHAAAENDEGIKHMTTHEDPAGVGNEKRAAVSTGPSALHHRLPAQTEPQQ